MCRICGPSIREFIGVDFAAGKDYTKVIITKNKPMKKYIWAKDTPFSKKGDKPIGLTEREIERLLAEGWIEEAGRFKPEHNEKYWYVSANNITRTVWFNDTSDRKYYERGNVFKTEEEATAAAEKVKALLLSLHE